MSLFKCILCFKEIEKDYERFLVKSKKTIFDVNIALANLDFLVYTASEYICRQCHSLLKTETKFAAEPCRIREIFEN